MENNSQKLNLAIGVVFLVAVLVLIYLAAVRSYAGSVAETTKPTIDLNMASVDPSYGNLGNMKELKLAENFESWTPEAKLNPDKTIAKSLMVQGQIAQAYLLVRASEGSDSLTKWDSIYFKLNNLGGHLFRPASLKVPTSLETTLFYNLRQVSVLTNIPYDESRTPDTANLFDALKPGRAVVVTSFISSLREGVINQLSLYYACTSGQDCKLELK